MNKAARVRRAIWGEITWMPERLARRGSVAAFDCHTTFRSDAAVSGVHDTLRRLYSEFRRVSVGLFLE